MDDAGCRPAVRRIEPEPGTRWTEVEMFTGGLPLTMDLRPRKERDVGGLVLGDRAFDRPYFLQAAPENAVREVFDDTVRARLLAIKQPLWIVHRERGFMLVQSGWLPEAELAQLTQLAALLAGAIARALDAVERSVATSGAPYRPEVAPDALVAIKTQRDAELRALAKARDRDVNWTIVKLMAKTLRWPAGFALLVVLVAWSQC